MDTVVILRYAVLYVGPNSVFFTVDFQSWPWFWCQSGRQGFGLAGCFGDFFGDTSQQPRSFRHPHPHPPPPTHQKPGTKQKPTPFTQTFKENYTVNHETERMLDPLLVVLMESIAYGYRSQPGDANSILRFQ